MIEHDELMLPFKVYLNAELKGCHQVKDLRILKNVQEIYKPIIFHPILPSEELVRIYIRLEQTEEIKLKKK